ncbi:hypothetical protein KR52_10340 [Synechococcus sp. KORDI-52]|nr:hypothetical protein KR52_10340 [Synechococcus sp. KORDI-52]
MERQANREAGKPYEDRTWDHLIDLAIKLKDPAAQTGLQWRQRVAEV